VKPYYSLLLSVVAFAGLFAAMPAGAQVTEAKPKNAGSDNLTNGRNNLIAFYPFAEFHVAGSNNGVNLNQVFDGSLIALESAFQTGKNSRQYYAVGAWGWFRGDQAIIETHARYQFTNLLGLQAGILEETKASPGIQSDFFVVADLSPRRSSKLGRLSLQLGLGAFVYQRNSTQFSGFLQGSYPIRPNLFVNASYWYVGSAYNGDVDRFMTGLSYAF